MTFGELIKIMNSANVFGCTRNDLALHLLKSAGIYLEGDRILDVGTVAKWIDRKVPNNIRSYFPDARVNEDEVIGYFRRWTKESWPKLQKAFRPEHAHTLDDFIIDYSTNDRDVFYRSLLSQFVKSLGLPMLEPPVSSKGTSTVGLGIVWLEEPEKQEISFTELVSLFEKDVEIIESTDDGRTNHYRESLSEIREFFDQAKRELDIPRAIIQDGTLLEIQDVLRQAISDCGTLYIITDITEEFNENILPNVRDFREVIVDDIVRPIERIGKHVESEAYDLLVALSATLKEYLDLPDDQFNLYGVSSESRIMLQAKIAFLIVKILGIDTSALDNQPMQP